MPQFRVIAADNPVRLIEADLIDIGEGVAAFLVGAKPLLIIPVHRLVSIEREGD